MGTAGTILCVGDGLLDCGRDLLFVGRGGGDGGGGGGCGCYCRGRIESVDHFFDGLEFAAGHHRRRGRGDGRPLVVMMLVVVVVVPLRR